MAFGVDGPGLVHLSTNSMQSEHRCQLTDELQIDTVSALNRIFEHALDRIVALAHDLRQHLRACHQLFGFPFCLDQLQFVRGSFCQLSVVASEDLPELVQSPPERMTQESLIRFSCLLVVSGSAS